MRFLHLSDLHLGKRVNEIFHAGGSGIYFKRDTEHYRCAEGGSGF